LLVLLYRRLIHNTFFYENTYYIYTSYFLVDEIKKKWKNIRDNYARDMNQQKNTISGSASKFYRKYAYADFLTFLQPVLKKRL